MAFPVVDRGGEPGRSSETKSPPWGVLQGRVRAAPVTVPRPAHLKVAPDQFSHLPASSAGSSVALWEIPACLGTTQLSAAALNYMVVVIVVGGGEGMKSAWEPQPTAGHTRAQGRAHTPTRERVERERE